MRTDSFKQGQRRAERMHWWRQVLDRPATANWDEVFDEMVSLRFQVADAGSGASDSVLASMQMG